MKKWTKLLAAFLMACLALAGCGTDTPKGDGTPGTEGNIPAQDVLIYAVQGDPLAIDRHKVRERIVRENLCHVGQPNGKAVIGIGVGGAVGDVDVRPEDISRHDTTLILANQIHERVAEGGLHRGGIRVVDGQIDVKIAIFALAGFLLIHRDRILFLRYILVRSGGKCHDPHREGHCNRQQGRKNPLGTSFALHSLFLLSSIPRGLHAGV